MCTDCRCMDHLTSLIPESVFSILECLHNDPIVFKNKSSHHNKWVEIVFSNHLLWWDNLCENLIISTFKQFLLVSLNSSFQNTNHWKQPKSHLLMAPIVRIIGRFGQKKFKTYIHGMGNIFGYGVKMNILVFS